MPEIERFCALSLLQLIWQDTVEEGDRRMKEGGGHVGRPNTFDESIHNDCIPISIFDTLQGPISRDLVCNTCYEVFSRRRSTMLCICTTHGILPNSITWRGPLGLVTAAITLLHICVCGLSISFKLAIPEATAVNTFLLQGVSAKL